jgi:CheY-like chemotaxis protein
MLTEEANDLGDEDYIPDLQRIRTAGEHLLALINDVLDISKIEAGKMELYLEWFEVSELVHSVVSTMQSVIEKKGNSFCVSCSDTMGKMYADLTKVRQNVFNLLSNANKFTEAGTVCFSVWGAASPPHAQHLPPTTEHSEEDSKWIVFQITDSGIGMSATQLEHIFEPFTQADASTTRKYGGTGLGLAITRRFCLMMGGEVVAASEQGNGTTFTMWLPREVQPEAAEQPPPAEIDTQLTSTPLESRDAATMDTVLVIDDDATVRDLVQRFLIREGFHVVAAASGDEGLRLAREIHPVAITLDVMMPGMDGWAVLSTIKADPQLFDIPVIMMTMVSDRNIGYALGAADYLIKPIDRSRLSNILHKYRRERQPGHVMLVEDDPDIRQIIRRMLAREGWDVVEAEHGRAGLEKMEQSTPDVILLDLMMPEMDGFEFISEVRRIPAWQTIPVVVISAMELTSEDRCRLDGHVTRILQKGAFSRDELLGRVRDLVVSSTYRAAGKEEPHL